MEEARGPAVANRMPMAEPIFEDDSDGYWEGQSAHDALATCR